MLPIIFGFSGLQLTNEEREFFRATQPFGYILFRRNIDTFEQTKQLVDELREISGRKDVPVLIDQEGGRVQRLRPPHWVDLPEARAIGNLYERSPAEGLHAAGMQAEIIAGMLTELGINVVCAPVMDLPVAEAHDVIGNRAFSEKADTVITLGAHMSDMFLQNGVMPILKHIPGHGRATADSHHECPVVKEDLATLEQSDFKIFKEASAKIDQNAWAMTAHVVYTALDAQPVSVSKIAIDYLRNTLNFAGPIIPDAVEMEALGGSIASRALATINAGCDASLHCSGKMEDMKAIADVLPQMSDEAVKRFAKAAQAMHAPVRKNWRETYETLKMLLEIKDIDSHKAHEALTIA